MNFPFYEKKEHKFYIGHYHSSHAYPLHFHNCIEISYCYRGTQTIMVDKNIYQLNSGDAMLIFPYIEHEYLDTSPNSSESETISIVCNIDSILEDFPVFLKWRPKNPCVKAELISDDVKSCFLKILENEDTMSRLGLTYVICSDLLKSLELIPNSLKRNYELSDLIITYINENFQKDLTIEMIASKFGYSSSYVAHIFYDKLKIPFRTYLNSVRSKYAATQMSTTTKNITEIAFASGFNSLNTFCRCFKKEYGITPSQYKKQMT